MEYRISSAAGHILELEDKLHDPNEDVYEYSYESEEGFCRAADFFSSRSDLVASLGDKPNTIWVQFKWLNKIFGLPVYHKKEIGWRLPEKIHSKRARCFKEDEGRELLLQALLSNGLFGTLIPEEILVACDEAINQAPVAWRFKDFALKKFQQNGMERD